MMVPLARLVALLQPVFYLSLYVRINLRDQVLAMTEFFTQNITIVFFIYGLSFFSMGFAILLELGHSTELEYARALRPLAFFGLVHGSHEWFEMFMIIRGHAAAPWIDWLRIFLLATSFLFLVAFGVRLIAEPSNRRLRQGIILSLTIFWIIGIYITIHTLPQGSDRLAAADVFTRYSLAIPASIVTVVGLLKQRQIFFQSNMLPCGRDATLAALAFGLYGIIGQLFTSRSGVFPSPYLNAEVFLQWFNFPIQLFRAILACLAAIFIIRSLRSFKVEARRQLDNLRTAQAAEQVRLEELRAELLHRTVQTQENERHRIARELHDETGQTLTALGMGLRGLQEAIPGNPQRAIEQARQLENLATGGIAELQRLVTGLHPPHLDDLGLLAAVRWYAGEISQRYQIPVILQGQGEKPKLTSEMRIAIFRIAQEAITNTIRHANADQITIRLDYQPEQIFLQIIDDGKGFDVDYILNQKMNGKPAWGLLGILERAALINGSCSILSLPGKGTTIELAVPITRNMTT
jgi:signal transduction histidine kinase